MGLKLVERLGFETDLKFILSSLTGFDIVEKLEKCRKICHKKCYHDNRNVKKMSEKNTCQQYFLMRVSFGACPLVTAWHVNRMLKINYKLSVSTRDNDVGDVMRVGVLN